MVFLQRCPEVQRCVCSKRLHGHSTSLPQNYQVLQDECMQACSHCLTMPSSHRKCRQQHATALTLCLFSIVSTPRVSNRVPELAVFSENSLLTAGTSAGTPADSISHGHLQLWFLLCYCSSTRASAAHQLSLSTLMPVRLSFLFKLMFPPAWKQVIFEGSMDVFVIT